MNKNMQNEPNLKNTKMNLTLFKRMDYSNFHPSAHRKNEPKTNPIQTQFAPDMLPWPAVRPLSTYSGQSLRNTVCASSRLPAKTAYLFRTANKKMQNEPNFKNTQKTVTSFTGIDYGNFHPPDRRQNEPKTNPIQARRRFCLITGLARNQLAQEYCQNGIIARTTNFKKIYCKSLLLEIKELIKLIRIKAAIGTPFALYP
jgi:hypothetical protein